MSADESSYLDQPEANAPRAKVGLYGDRCKLLNFVSYYALYLGLYLAHYLTLNLALNLTLNLALYLTERSDSQIRMVGEKSV